MTRPHRMKHSLCIVAFALLSAVSASASAQSNEFRQGYDQGYRDNAEAQGQPGHGNQEGRITVEEARYGSLEDGFCDARESIQHSIGWRRHADIHAGSELCGSPSTTHVKHLEVRYHCGTNQPLHADAQENGVLSLSCP